MSVRYATVTTAAPNLLPKDVLLELLPAAFGPWGASGAFPSRPPTHQSVSRIESELGIRVPPLFIDVAQACDSYGGWFGSIGNDFASHNHLLSINRAWREEGVPPRYVLLNHGHDGDCDAWDTEPQALSTGERPIVYFRFDSDRRALSHLCASANSFAEYIDAFVRAHAPRCPVKGLRRKAKRVLAERGGPAVA